MSEPKSRTRASSHSEGSLNDAHSTPSNSGSHKLESMDEENSQDDMKSETGMNATGSGMALRDRSKRSRPNYRYAVEEGPPAPPERRSSIKTEKASSAAVSTEVSHWLQCDACHKWRIVAHKLFDDLKKLSRFECRNLQGVTCKDRDDWASAGASDDTSVKDDGTQNFRRRARKHIKRINIFSGKYIPGFAGEFSDLGED